MNNLERPIKTSKQLRYQNRKLLKLAQSAPIKTASPVYRSFPMGMRRVTPVLSVASVAAQPHV